MNNVAYLVVLTTYPFPFSIGNGLNSIKNEKLLLFTAETAIINGWKVNKILYLDLEYAPYFFSRTFFNKLLHISVVEWPLGIILCINIFRSYQLYPS